jgi:Na+/H+ antiporter NhaD/arsenite permease-like protein
MVTPFFLLLLCIALLPILAKRFWHSNLRKGIVSLGLSLPVVIYLIYHQMRFDDHSLALLAHTLLEYVDFIVPLAALYIIAGGIVLRGDIRPTPLANSTLLAVGATLANVIGTTGASMLLIRPMLRINKGRKFSAHVPVFFIFMVSNTGGLLLPVGDPPLLLGFLHGVDFFWTLSLWPHWLVANGLILTVFFIWDVVIRRYEPRISPGNLAGKPANTDPQPIRIDGLINLLFLAGILATIVLQSEALAGPFTAWARQYVPFFPNVHLGRPWNIIVMVLLAGLSWICTPKQLRRDNDFTWEAMIEVAVLFLGIFVTMAPALDLLEVHGQELGLTQPWQFFWLTGLLSGFLDNAPTYLTFATVAAGPRGLHGVMLHEPHILQAISCGAVFMGALSYVGNAPNFMVKTIAESAGYCMPTFFGYFLRAGMVLLPIYVAVTLLFFLT